MMGRPYIRVPFPLYFGMFSSVLQQASTSSLSVFSLSPCVCRGDPLSLSLAHLLGISHLHICSISSAATLTWYQSAWSFEGRRRAAFSAIGGCGLSEELVAEIEAEFAFSWCGSI